MRKIKHILTQKEKLQGEYDALMSCADKATVRLQELIIASLAQTDALSKLLIEKGLITEAEFMKKLSAERDVYQAMMEKVR